MTLEELNCLRETYSFPLGVRVRLPEEGETIVSACPGEVAFYEAAFPAGLRFPIHSTIRLILQFYNICRAQLVPNAWRTSLALWRCGRRGIRRPCSEDTPATSRGGRANSSSLQATSGSFPKMQLGKAPHGFRGHEEFQIITVIIRPGSMATSQNFSRRFFKSVEKSGHFSVPVLLESRSFHRVFVSPGSMASGTTGEERPRGGALSSSGDTAMSKRISFKKLGEKLKKSKNGSSSGTPAPVKGVGKGVDRELKGKKKATSSSNAPTTLATASSHPREGTSANLSTVLGPTASILGSPSVAEKLLWGVIPSTDKEKVDKLTLDQMATKLFHMIGQALVLGSFLAVRSREAGEHPSLQEGRAASMESEQTNDELAKIKSGRDSFADKFERSGVLVVELKEALNKAKEFTVEEFKSSSEFLVAVEDSASKYFGEGFEFYKVQLRQHHPNLAIDLEGTVLNQDLLAEQDEATEEKEKLGKNEGGGEKDTAPL
ncbi:hypothetical protein Acr_10g0010590 [Actinidia rufa]|uniref:Uncharacterized protein n=1 Tax=Actinidia rufa TaxID=165716 RepID=A0A7J0FAE1_9ERIC|nr:hypothetical protein Acr_10g0010590 [Actinidia rufa]